MRTKRLPAAALAVAAALALSGCEGLVNTAPTASATPSKSQTPTPSATPTARATPTPTPTENAFPTAETISCETMLVPAVADQLRAEGLAPGPKNFTILNFTPTLPAIECPWGEDGYYHAIVYYAWAQLAPGERDTLLDLAGQNNMTATQLPDGDTWLSWGPDAPADSAGLLVTDEWAAAALTPEDVGNIVWTR